MLTPSIAVKLARDNITEEEFVSIFRAAVELAKQGDKQARDWVSNLVLPKEPDKDGFAEDRVKEIKFRVATEGDYAEAQEKHKRDAEDHA